MQNNNPNNYLQEDEINLKEILKLLINSKKLIIVTTLIITLLGAIYSFQKEPVYESTALIEIGNYKLDKYNQMIIEPTPDLINELNIVFILKHKLKISIKPLEDRLIQISHTSPSSVTSKNLLNEIISYIKNRHSFLLSNRFQETENRLTYEIERLNDQIEFSNKVLLTQNEDKKLRITNELESLNNQLPEINLKIESYNSIILEDQSNLKLLESKPDLFLQRAAQSPTLNQVIHSYKIELLDFEAVKINLLQEKNNLEAQLKFLESDDYLESDEIFKLSQKKDNLESQLRLLESNNLESDEIFKLSQDKDSLELKLEFLMQQNTTNTQLYGKILANDVSTKKELIILLSFIFGLFLSIVIVFINNFLKAFKEKQV